jgi:hypothetical protein
MIQAYQKMVDRMVLAGLGLNDHRLDNEFSKNFKKCICKNNMTHKLVPLNCRRRNMAKRVIQTFKNHFVAILSRVDDRFPLLLWCHLVQPAKLTINLLCQSNPAPKNIGICPRARTARLYEMSLCTTGIRSNGPRQTQELTDVGRSWGGWLQHWNIDGAPSVFSCLYFKNKSNEGQQLSIFQTSIHHELW